VVFQLPRAEAATAQTNKSASRPAHEIMFRDFGQQVILLLDEATREDNLSFAAVLHRVVEIGNFGFREVGFNVHIRSFVLVRRPAHPSDTPLSGNRLKAQVLFSIILNYFQSSFSSG
jgi:hypothetical protein